MEARKPRDPELIRAENKSRWPYKRRATGQVMHVGMNYLTELVIRPGIRKYLEPLCLYRGEMNPGSAHRYWNFALLMMAAEAQTLADGVKLHGNAAFAQLCGPHRQLSILTLGNFFGRLWDNPDVTNEMSGLTEYVKSLELGPSRLQHIPYLTHTRYCAPWRVSDHPDYEAGAQAPETGIRALYYPYLAHDPEKDGAHALVLLANQLVPKYLPDQLRADTCQDLIEGMLTGKVSADNAPDFVCAYLRDQYKLHPHIWDGKNNPVSGRPISFDRPLQFQNGDSKPWTEIV